MAEEQNVVAGVVKHGERKHWVYIMLMTTIAFILLLMTLGVLALRDGNYLPEGTDILFIVGKNPSVQIGDEENQTWETGKNVNIFRTGYENENGVTTVLANDGSKLIAPGTEMSYQFTMYNDGNMAVTYYTDIDFILIIGGEKQQDYKFPLLVRLVNQSGEYLIGGPDEWEEVDKAARSFDSNVLGANSYQTFDLQLKWLFDGTDDELDTYLGNASVEEGVDLTLRINTYAEEHIDPAAKGGIAVSEGDQEVGGTVRYFWLIMLFIDAAIIIFYIAWLLNKRLRKW